MTQPTFFNCYPIEYNQRLCYYPFAVNLDRYVGHCNTFNDLANRTYVPNKRKDLNLHYVYMITAENESKTIAIHMSCECTSIFDGKAYDLNQKQNNNNRLCECKSPKEYIAYKKHYIQNQGTCNC